MKQPAKHVKNKPKPAEIAQPTSETKPNVAVSANQHGKCKAKDQKYGTSKLEKLFATEFLDKMGLKYIYQFEAADIKRFFDFAVTTHVEVEYPMETKDGIACVKQGGKLFQITFMVEIDGDYYHFNPETNEGKKMNGMQIHNRFVDSLKNHWCGMHCIPLLRIWENDIRKNPQKVMQQLEEYAGKSKKRRILNENPNKNS